MPATPTLDLPGALTSLGLALLIGLIVGVQRESVQREHRPGLRDFVLIALGGAVCALLDNVALTVDHAGGHRRAACGGARGTRATRRHHDGDRLPGDFRARLPGGRAGAHVGHDHGHRRHHRNDGFP